MDPDYGEKYCLRWNDFASNLELSFKEFRQEQVFFDVTVACEDGQLGAHKAVLSAGSPLFRQILRQNPHAHPLLYLRGLRQAQLGAVLDFMYLGEVSIRHTQLESFLSLAEELKVKGLIQAGSKGGSGDEEEEEEEESGNVSSSSASSGHKRKRKRRHRSRSSTNDDNKRPPPPAGHKNGSSSSNHHSSSKQVKTEALQDGSYTTSPHHPPPTSQYTTTTTAAGSSCSSGGGGSSTAASVKEEPLTNSLVVRDTDPGEECGGGELEDSYDEQYLVGSAHFEEYSRNMLNDPGDAAAGGMGETNLKADILVRSKMVESADGGWQCAECDFLGNINRVYKHVETNHVLVAYFCETCNKRCKTRNSLFCHRYRYHRAPRPLKTGQGGSGGGAPEHSGDPGDVVAQYALQFQDTPTLDLRP